MDDGIVSNAKFDEHAINVPGAPAASMGGWAVGVNPKGVPPS